MDEAPVDEPPNVEEGNYVAPGPEEAVGVNLERLVDPEEPLEPGTGEPLTKELSDLFAYLKLVEVFMIFWFTAGAVNMQEAILRYSKTNGFAWCAKAALNLIFTWYMFILTLICFAMFDSRFAGDLLILCEDWRLYVFSFYSAFLLASAPWLYQAAPIGVYWVVATVVGMSLFAWLSWKFN